jgi:protein ImuB
LRRASTDTAHLVALLRTRLESLALLAPVEAIALDALELTPLPGVNTDLFERNAIDEASAERLIERLKGRLGPAVRQWRLRADHRPECAQEAAEGGEAVATSGAERPLYLLDPPQPLGDWAALGDRRVTLVGPERIESGWWDDAPVRRDYFRAHTRDGATFWIFRETGAAQRWFVHGIFA